MLHLLLYFGGVDGPVPAVDTLSETESDLLADVNQLLLELKGPLLEVAILKGAIVFSEDSLLSETQNAHGFIGLH